jgi:hypothetical protein
MESASPVPALDPDRPEDDRVVAEALIAHFGEQATAYAAAHALRARQRGDASREAAWRRLAGMMVDLLRTPVDGIEP